MDIILHHGNRPGAIGTIAALHGTYYAHTWGLGVFFEAKVARDLAAFVLDADPARDGLWLALVGEQIVGSVAIDGAAANRDGARLRWFIVDPACRGAGLGRRLLAEAMQFCDARGYPRVYLTTFVGLDATRHLYEQVGFRLEHEHEDTTWGHPLHEQTFVRVRGGTEVFLEQRQQ
jgi:GNAT superfamily N-acetyltransferase